MKILNVIIPAAGLGRRMRSYGNKSLIQLGRETVISRQIRIIKESFKDTHITIVTGFESQKIKRGLPDDITFVKNSDFVTTNVAHSICLGMEKCKRGPVLIVYGDLVFSKNMFKPFPLDKSLLVIEEGGNRPEEIGVHYLDNQVICLDYGLPQKWAHILYLTQKDRLLFKKMCDNQKLFTFEVLNKMLNAGVKISAFVPTGVSVAEIDCSKDIDLAKKVAKQ